MATSEIDKLERRYAENPHGLTFAPLAEVHRKNGDINRALELLRIGLELHPNYIPASIVLGRCHQDLGDLPAAEAAFAHVLRLDDENVIALKSLADMNERQDRLDEAERWLRRLVSVDRSNDEARHQLERIEAVKAKAGSRATPEAPAPKTADDAAPEVAPVETAASAAPAESVPIGRNEQPETPALELMDDVREKAVEPTASPPAPADERVAASAEARPEALAPREPAPAPVDAAPLAGLETAEFEPPKSPVAGPLGLEIETESDVVLNSSGASEFSVPDASQDLAALAARWNAGRPRSPGRRASDRAATEVPQPVIAPAAQSESPEPAPSPSSPPKPYSAQATKGQSIAAFFQALLAARPPEGSNIPTTHFQPAESSVNGENRSASAEAAQAGGLVSFDDFFGSATGGKSHGGSDAEPGKDDLDQFHSWLQNLKR